MEENMQTGCLLVPNLEILSKQYILDQMSFVVLYVIQDYFQKKNVILEMLEDVSHTKTRTHHK